MKKIIIIFCLLCVNVFGQYQTMYPSLELFMRVINQNNTQTEISLSSISNTWDYNKYTDQFFITTDQDILNSSVIITGTDTSNNNGWDMVTSKTAGGAVCGIAVYKMQANVGNAYFYIDFRECQFALGSQAEIDTWFRYNRDEDNFYWNDLLREDVWHSISGEELIRIWDIKNTTPLTSCIDYFWENCLVLIPSEGSNHPRFVWGPYPDDEFEVTHYRIYIRVEQGNWNLRAVVGSNTFEFTDNQVDLNSKVEEIEYYVKAYNGSTESSATNTVTVIGQYNPNKEIAGKNTEHNFRGIALDCFPNPFNPKTIISYQLASDSYITLKVFDLLGREITTLAEGIKPAGKYEAVFSVGSFGKAEGLPSGTYIYTLNVNGKVFSKKMTLLK